MTLGSSPRIASSIRYLEAPPEGVSEATRKALEPFAPRYCAHEPDAGGRPWQGHGFAGCLIERRHWLDAHRALQEAGFGLLRDHTAVDYPERTPRFTVVSLPVNLDTQEELIVKCRVGEGESVPSLTPLWRSADWAERETFDMFGIVFEGHPNLTRIYMPEDYEGWPMRRDFPLQGHIRFQD